MSNIVLVERIESKILLIRGQKVILDRDLAELYGVTTKRLNEQVKRNVKRFPENFMFRLSKKERDELVANCDRFEKLKHSTSTPSVFTEHGCLMTANILNSDKAVDVSILIIDAFVRLRQMISSNVEIAKKISELEKRLDTHDEIIVDIVQSVKRLLDPGNEPQKKPQIGFN